MGVNPIPWDIKTQTRNVLEVHKSTDNIAEITLLNEDINVSHQSTQVVNEINEVEMSDAGNDNNVHFDIMRESSPKTYASGKEIFCNFLSEDSNIDYLNKESNVLNNKINSKISKVNANSMINSSKNSNIKITSKSNLIIKQLSKRNFNLQKHVGQLNFGLKNSIRTQKENLQLHKKNKILERTVKKQEQNLRKLKYKNDVLLANLDIDNYLDYQKCTSPLSRTMVKLQLHRKNAPYSEDEKRLAKLIFFHSASCYSRLRKAGVNLPCESTLRYWISEISIEPGFSNDLLELINKALTDLPEDERLCALKWDEMSIKAWEEYNKKLDLIEGLVDLGEFGRRPDASKQILLLCLDSINVTNPWRQIFAYFFTGSGVSGQELERIISKGLKYAKEQGALIKLVACDQGTANRNVYSLFNVSLYQPYFILEESKYYASFDWPHLIKRLIYQLRKYKRIYCNGEIIVDFDDFYNTWLIDNLNTTSNLLSHLSQTHFDPNSFEAMNVKRAFQLLSLRMSSAIKLAGPNGLQSTTWKKSAEFSEYMNAVIDAFNSRNEKCRNPLKRIISDRNPEILERLINFKTYVNNWKIKKKSGKFEQPPCFVGMSLTVSSLIDMYNNIKLEHKNFELATALCNTDSVEHLNCNLRGRGGYNRNPTGRQCRLAIRHIISTNHLFSSDKGNVNCTEAPSLVQFQNIVKSKDCANNTENEVESANTYRSEELVEFEQEPLLEAFFNSDFYIAFDKYADSHEPYSSLIEDKGEYERNAITYFAGHVAKRCLMKSQCDRCRTIFTKKTLDDSHATDEKYISYREYEHQNKDAPAVSFLTRPTDEFKKIISIQLDAYSAGYERWWHENLLRERLVEFAEACTNEYYKGWFDEVNDNCYEHKKEALKYLFLVKIYAKTREHNHKFKYAATRTLSSNNTKLKNIINV